MSRRLSGPRNNPYGLPYLPAIRRCRHRRSRPRASPFAAARSPRLVHSASRFLRVSVPHRWSLYVPPGEPPYIECSVCIWHGLIVPKRVPPSRQYVSYEILLSIACRPRRHAQTVGLDRHGSPISQNLAAAEIAGPTVELASSKVTISLHDGQDRKR